MKFASIISNACKRPYLKSASRLVLVILCCIPSVSAQQKTKALAEPDLKTQFMAFLKLEPLAKAMGSVSPDHTQESKTSPLNQSLGSGTKEQYIALYNALKKLEETRGQYLETLNLYVGAVKTNLSSEIRRRRLDAFKDALAGLRTDLQTLKDAFGPLQLPLKYENQEVSDSIDQYISSRQAKGAAASVIDTLSISELQDLSTQAAANGKLIGDAVAKLFDLIKHRYPTIAMVTPRVRGGDIRRSTTASPVADSRA